MIINKGFQFLAQETEEAHLAGDGIRVLHLCRTAFDYLERKAKSNTLGDIAIEDVFWSFCFALCWAFSDYELLVVRELLKVLPSRDALHPERAVASQVLMLLENPFQPQPTANLIALPATWLASHSTDRASIALLPFVIELTWTHDPFGDSWQELARQWAVAAGAGTPLSESIHRVLDRLRYQTFLTLGRWPNGCDARNVPTQVPTFAEAYRLFCECKWEELDRLIRQLVHRTGVEDPSYIPLFRLVHSSRFYRKTEDGQLISLSRYNLSSSHQPLRVYDGLRERSFLDHSLSLARSQESGGGAGDRAATFRLAMLSELSALRTWDLAAWRHSVGEQAQVALELASHQLENHAEVHFAKLGIVNLVKALQANEKDSRLRNAVARLDTTGVEDRVAVVRELVAARPMEWADAHTALKLISDSIPEKLLPEVAKWTVDLELTTMRLRAQRRTWLGFWGDIIKYVPNGTEVVSVLFPALLHACGNPLAWLEDYETLVGSLVRGPLELAYQLLEKMESHPTQQFDDDRWRIVFNACVERIELRDRALPWLKGAAGNNAIRMNHILRMERGFPVGPIDDVALRNTLTGMANGFVATMSQSNQGPFPILGGINSQPFQLVTWNLGDMPFVEGICKAIDNPNGTPNGKLCLLQLLAAIAKVGADEIVDAIAANASRWLDAPLAYSDPTANYSGPLSIFSFVGMGPESLERGLWWLGCSLLDRRLNAIREVLTRRVLHIGLSASVDVADLVFVAMLRLALAGSAPNDPTNMAIIGMSEALATITAPEQLGCLVRTFGVLLEGDKFSVAKFGNNEAGRLLLDCWSRRLPRLALSSAAEVRNAVAGVLRIWSGLPASHSWVTFPQSLATCLESLKSDARARVRWAATAKPDEIGELD